MKIRIKGNSIRLRLTRPEVDYFGKEGLLEEATSFGCSTFRYTLKSSESLKVISAAFSEGNITVYLPAALTKKWVSTEKVGYSGEMEIGEEKKLYILIEKDFKCLDNTIEDQSDNYPNPLAEGK